MHVWIHSCFCNENIKISITDECLWHLYILTHQCSMFVLLYQGHELVLQEPLSSVVHTKITHIRFQKWNLQVRHQQKKVDISIPLVALVWGSNVIINPIKTCISLRSVRVHAIFEWRKKGPYLNELVLRFSTAAPLFEPLSPWSSSRFSSFLARVSLRVETYQHLDGWALHFILGTKNKQDYFSSC